MTFSPLAPLVDRGILFTLLGQEQLSERIAALDSLRWHVDMAAKTITFSSETNPAQSISAPIELVATIAPGPRSMLWGWAHPQGGPDSPSVALREYGQQNGIEMLTTAEVPFPDDAPDGGESLQQWISATAHDLGTSAVEVTGRRPYYSTPLGNGSQAVFLLGIDLREPVLSETLVVLPRLLAGEQIRDPRTAIWSLAGHAGWHLQWTDDRFEGATLTDGVSTATFVFSEAGLVTNMQPTLN